MNTKLLFLLFLAFLDQIGACTAFQIQAQDGSYVYCRSLEFGYPFNSDVLISPRNIPFEGSIPDGKGIQTTLKYGYVGLNQNLDPIHVSDGMNEKGLVVGSLYLPGLTQYEPFNTYQSKSSLGPWELPSYLLGTCTNIEEVKKVLESIHVVEQSTPGVPGWVVPLHYYVADQSGKVLVIEFIEGKKRVIDNSLGVLTNSPTLDWHLLNLGNYFNASAFTIPHKDFNNSPLTFNGQGNGLHGIPGDYSPPSRFVRAAVFTTNAIPATTGEAAVLLGLHILNTFDIFAGAVRPDPQEKDPFPFFSNPASKPVPSYETTQWIVLHDRKNLKTYIRTYESQKLQMVDLKKLDFTQPILKTIVLDKTFTPDDITSKTTLMNSPSSNMSSQKEK